MYSQNAGFEKINTNNVSKILIISYNIKLNCNLIANKISKSRVELKFGAGEGIRILDPLNLCFMGFQKMRKYIELF